MHKKFNELTFIKSEIFSSFLMVASLICAMLICNTASLADYYEQFISYPMSLKLGHFEYDATLISIVNDGLMTFFFLLIGMELKYHLTFGEYQDRKTLALPTAAAIGGFVVPALIYVAFNFNQDTLKGWAIPIASDTAFMLGILSFFGRHIPSRLRAFVISFSLIDDALALVVLAIFYTKSFSIFALVISIMLFILLIVFNYLNFKSSLYYLVVGVLLWIAMVEAGMHGTLAGVIVALTIPVRADGDINISFQKLDKKLQPFVHYLILPLFIFINSGIKIEYFTFDNACSNISLGIILGLFIGKQLGISGFSYGAVKYFKSSLPEGTNWLGFYAVSILGGIGFTLSLFIGGLTFEDGCAYYSMRSAVILGSLLSAVFGAALLYYSIRRKN